MAKCIYDVTRKNDPAYWAAALVLAIKHGKSTDEKTARRNLVRLGYDLTRIDTSTTPEKSEVSQ
ncbi:hypothetical protein [Neorhodopirellula pilleata]|uniref:Uncharacterized protein n=1 Tax=Neorhodopirellula pilleata TaxID=2714738 RepID=A0A5C5ZLF9_9BACT|nr:hypothetical protein [Neorhodopirellula pilleata]TWT88005.1 hypothetical protein Pla100_57350 [Neorhodopirellula pilleata]